MSSCPHCSHFVDPLAGEEFCSNCGNPLRPSASGPGLPPPPGFDLDQGESDSTRVRTLIGLPESELEQLRKVIPAENDPGSAPADSGASEPYSIDLSLLPDSDELSSLGIETSPDSAASEPNPTQGSTLQMPGLDLGALELDLPPGAPSSMPSGDNPQGAAQWADDAAGEDPSLGPSSIPLDLASEDYLPAPGSQLPAPGSQLPRPSSPALDPGADLPSPGAQLPAPGSRLPKQGVSNFGPDADLPSPGSQLPAPGSQLPAPGSQLPAPGSHLPAPGSQLPAPGSQLPAPGSQLPAPGSQLPAPGSQLPGLGVDPLPAPGGQLPTAASQLPHASSRSPGHRSPSGRVSGRANPPPLRPVAGGAKAPPPPPLPSRAHSTPPPRMRAPAGRGGAASAALADLAAELPALDDLDALDPGFGAAPVSYQDQQAELSPDPSSPPSSTERRPRIRRPHLRRSGPLRDLSVVQNSAEQDLEGSHQISSVAQHARRGGRPQAHDEAIPGIGDLDLDLDHSGGGFSGPDAGSSLPNPSQPLFSDSTDALGAQPLDLNENLPNAAEMGTSSPTPGATAAYYPHGSPAPKNVSGGSSRRLIWGVTGLLTVAVLAGVGGWYTGFFDQIEDIPNIIHTPLKTKTLDTSQKQLQKLAAHKAERSSQTLEALFSSSPQSYATALGLAAASNDVVAHVELNLVRALRHPDEFSRLDAEVARALGLSSHLAKNPNPNVARVFALAKLQAGDSEGAETLLSSLDEKSPPSESSEAEKAADKDKKSSRTGNKQKRRSKAKGPRKAKSPSAAEQNPENFVEAPDDSDKPKDPSQYSDALVPYYRALVALDQQRSDDAKRHLQKALAFYPQFRGAQVLLETLELGSDLRPESLQQLLAKAALTDEGQSWALDAAYFAYRSGWWNEAESLADAQKKSLEQEKLRDEWTALEVRIAISRGDHQKAIRACEQVLKRRPDSPTFQNLRLEATLAAQQYEAVQVLAENIMAKSTPTPQIWLARAEGHAAVGQGDVALAELDRVAEHLATGKALPKNLPDGTAPLAPPKDPKTDILHNLPSSQRKLGAKVATLRARVYAMRKNLDLAQRYYEMAQELDPLAPQATIELAELFRKSERSRLAQTNFEQVLNKIGVPKTLHQRNAVASLQLAQAKYWVAEGRSSSAWDALNKAEKSQPLKPETQLELALQLRAKGQSERSQKTLLQLQDTVGQLPGMSSPLTEVYLQTKQYAKLEELIGPKLSSPQASIELLLSGSRLRLAQGQVDKANELVERILLKEPDLWQARMIKAQIYYTQGEIQPALTEINRSQPPTPDAMRTLWLGKIYAANGNTKAAYSHYENASRQQPGWAEPKIFMAKTLAERGSARKAISMLQPILRQHKNEAGAYLAMGIAHRDLRQFDVALRYFRQAQRLAPGHYRGFYEEGRIVNNRNQHRDAIRALERALDAQSPALPFNFRLDALRRLGTSYVSVNDRAHAQATLERFLVEAPSNDPAIPSVRRLLRSL